MRLEPAAVIERELNGWRDAIVEGDRSQHGCLYCPGRTTRCACSLALLESGVLSPDPFAYQRIEVLVDRFDPLAHRRSIEGPASPAHFAAGQGVLAAWARPHLEVGHLTPEEWASIDIAAVWWRPHKGGMLCEYREGESDEPLHLGDPARGRWGEEFIPVHGPPVPNNLCPRPLRVRPMYVWTHAGDRQLELLTAP